jgi:DNA-binding NtrC family response regulator
MVSSASLPPPSPKVLILEDEERLRRVLTLQLESSGYEVRTAATAEEALLRLDGADLVLTDLRLPGMDGLSFLDELKLRHPRALPVVMTAFSSVETAVEAMKRGAVDFLPKPFSLEHMMAVIEKAREYRALREENRALKDALGQRYSLDSLIGSGARMREIASALLRVAPARSTVLLCGESGVGKDLIARAIHRHSPRCDGPFVKINCTALPESLMESELFGHEKGAFTGAAAARPGRFEQAGGGTVFLDEIGDVPPSIQVKLLRVLQDREVERLGSNRVRHVDVRIIAATNADLRRALEEGNFRQDLYYRLNVFPITIPPLRERKEDIPALAGRFLSRFAAELEAPVSSISPAALSKLMDYHWPGNVRELENVMERSLVLARGPELGPEEIRLDESSTKTAAPGAAATDSWFLPDGLTLDQHERQLIREALRRAGGNKSQAARLLGLTRNAFRYRLSAMGMEP